MAIDGIFLHHLVKELKILESGRISKIKQLTKMEVLFVIRSQRINHQLLISASPDYARLHLTNHTYEADLSTPNFLMVLRKHLDGAIIESINQVEADRIVEIKVRKRNELGDIVYRTLHIEIMGKHSNIILSEDGKIIDAIKRVPPFQNSFRTILPGFEYQYPRRKELNPFTSIQMGTFEDLMTYQGISPNVANEILYRGDTSIIHASPTPVILQGKKEAFYFIPLYGYEIKSNYDTLNELLDVYYFNRNQIEKVKQRGKDLTIFIKNELDKNKNKLEKLYIDLRKSEQSDLLRQKGELLLNHQNEISKGMTEITLLNFYTNEEIQVSLDFNKTAVQNANTYFTKYNKAKKSIKHLETQILQTKDTIEYFDLLSQQILDATVNDIDEIRQELEDKKYLKQKTKRKKQKPNYDSYLIDGVEILVGRNNLQNEYVTHTLANKQDIWMHAQNIPGSHVVIRTNNPTETVLRAGANLASYYSKAKNSNSVPVDYTFVKYIKKIPGKVASFVTFTNQKTIYIDPDEQALSTYEKIK